MILFTSTSEGAEKCPLGCGHAWHGLPCDSTYPRPCGCPGPFPVAPADEVAS